MPLGGSTERTSTESTTGFEAARPGGWWRNADVSVNVVAQAALIGD